MDAIREYWDFVLANGPIIVAIGAYVMVGAGVVFAVMWDLHRWYRKRELNMLRYWFQKVRELMPKGVKGTSDSHAKVAVSQACYEAIFELAAAGKIRWKDEEYYNQLLAIAFGSETLRKEKTHKAAMRNRVEKNIASVQAGPVKVIPGHEKKGLGYLSRKSA